MAAHDRDGEVLRLLGALLAIAGFGYLFDKLRQSALRGVIA
jgi:hypothetical protein